MTVRLRVLEARLIEKARKNPELAKEMGIQIKYSAHLDNRIKNDETQLIHKNDQLLK